MRRQLTFSSNRVVGEHNYSCPKYYSTNGSLAEQGMSARGRGLTISSSATLLILIKYLKLFWSIEYRSIPDLVRTEG
jgi:hypothetical protein